MVSHRFNHDTELAEVSKIVRDVTEKQFHCPQMLSLCGRTYSRLDCYQSCVASFRVFSSLRYVIRTPFRGLAVNQNSEMRSVLEFIVTAHSFCERSLESVNCTGWHGRGLVDFSRRRDSHGSGCRSDHWSPRRQHDLCSVFMTVGDADTVHLGRSPSVEKHIRIGLGHGTALEGIWLRTSLGKVSVSRRQKATYRPPGVAEEVAGKSCQHQRPFRQHSRPLSFCTCALCWPGSLRESEHSGPSSASHGGD